jgi:hypothetical protein
MKQASCVSISNKSSICCCLLVLSFSAHHFTTYYCEAVHPPLPLPPWAYLSSWYQWAIESWLFVSMFAVIVVVPKEGLVMTPDISGHINATEGKIVESLKAKFWCSKTCWCWCQWRLIIIRWTTQCQCYHWNEDSFFPKLVCLKGKHGVSGRGIVASLDTFKPKR